jgi:hypothetical protein
MNQLSFTYEAAKKIINNWRELVRALEFPKEKEETVHAWECTEKMLLHLNSKSPDIEQCKRDGVACMKAFVDRWMETDVTRYIHMLCSYLWELQQLGSKKKTYVYHFTGKQLEAANHVDQKYFINHSLRGGTSGKKKETK